MKLRSIWPVFLMVVAACSTVGSPGSQTVEIKQKAFSAATNDAQFALVNVGATFEKVFISALDSADQLIDAEVEYIGDVTFTDTGTTTRTLTLTEDTQNLAYDGDRPLRWNVLLAGSVPLDLSLSLASGELSLDGSGLNLSKLALDVSSGMLDADLGASKDLVALDANVASGTVTINLPKSAKIDLTHGQVSSGTLNLNIGEANDVSVSNVTIASGSFVIDAPDDAAVRLEVKNVASGMMNLAFGLVRISGTDPDEGIWETEGFADAKNQINIVIDDIASGTFELR